MYTRRINFREGWRGYLWQGRFASFTMDENLLVSSCFLNEGISDWSAYLMGLESQEDEVKLEKAMKTGRPLGSDDFIDKLEILLKRPLKKKKPGPKISVN